MSEQEFFDTSNLIFHNFERHPIIIPNASKKKVKENKVPPVEMPVEKKPEPVERSQQVDDFLQLLKQEAVSLKKSVPEPPPVAKPPSPFDRDDAVIIHCLPAVLDVIDDPTYGEKRNVMRYGEKTLFKALLVDIDPIQIFFFVESDIKSGSIIYPSKYSNGKSFEDLNWWKVKSCQPRKGGFLLVSEITDQQVDFSGR